MTVASLQSNQKPSPCHRSLLLDGTAFSNEFEVLLSSAHSEMETACQVRLGPDLILQAFTYLPCAIEMLVTRYLKN